MHLGTSVEAAGAPRSFDSAAAELQWWPCREPVRQRPATARPPLAAWGGVRGVSLLRDKGEARPWPHAEGRPFARRPRSAPSAQRAPGRGGWSAVNSAPDPPMPPRPWRPGDQFWLGPVLPRAGCAPARSPPHRPRPPPLPREAAPALGQAAPALGQAAPALGGGWFRPAEPARCPATSDAELSVRHPSSLEAEGTGAPAPAEASPAPAGSGAAGRAAGAPAGRRPGAPRDAPEEPLQWVDGLHRIRRPRPGTAPCGQGQRRVVLAVPAAPAEQPSPLPLSTPDPEPVTEADFAGFVSGLRERRRPPDSVLHAPLPAVVLRALARAAARPVVSAAAAEPVPG
eukprot:TRINITY_DN22732_c0_g1_i1.p4 TRINITY_DN22732_c0_g1~~TRINITY_DN22732_c0_g1_i1.p4  ORF type:complete len:342 (+),score=52.18 TRINITY_DN22732_c0_g1_i1:82-1107(+)